MHEAVDGGHGHHGVLEDLVPLPRDFKRMDAAEVLVDHIINYNAEDREIRSETECESQWPELRKSLVLANAPVKRMAA